MSLTEALGAVSNAVPDAKLARCSPPGEVGRLHPDEAKHVFVFSSAGKPIFSYHGDANTLAGFTATAQALMSVVEVRPHGRARAGAQPVWAVLRSTLALPLQLRALGSPSSPCGPGSR